MDFRILSYVLVLGGLSGIVQMGRSGWSWYVHQISALTLMTLFALAALVLPSPTAGWIALVLFSLFALLPALSRLRVDQLFGRLRFRQALTHARRFRFLRPGRAGLLQLKAIEMTALATEGKIEEAEALYRGCIAADPPDTMRARLDMYWVLANGFARRWSSIRSGFQEGNFLAVSGTRTFMKSQAARALAETGAPEAGMALLLEAFPDATTADALVQLYVAYIACCALAGDIEGLENAFSDPLLKRFPPYTAEYWRGRCLLVRGEGEKARAAFEAVEGQLLPRATLWRAAVASLKDRCREGTELPGILRQDSAVPRIRRELEGAWLRIRAARIFLLQDGVPIVTRGLTAAILLVWLVCEWSGGSRSLAVLESAGALVPELIAQGQYWRLITATFLHIGFLHLSLNALALIYFGPTVERVLGPARYFLLFLLCGIGGGLAGLRFGSYGLAAGASGAIFGILGVTIIMAWRWDWGEFRTLRSRFVGSLLFLIVANFGIGLLEGGIDDLGHFGGLVTGILFGAILAGQPPSPRQGRRRALDPLVWILGLGLFFWGAGRGISWFGGRHGRLSAPAMTVCTSPEGNYRIFLPTAWPRKRDGNRLRCYWHDGTELLLLSTEGGELPRRVTLPWLEQEASAYGHEYLKRSEFSEIRPSPPELVPIGGRIYGRIHLRYRLFGRSLCDELYFPSESPKGPILRFRYESSREEALRPLFARILSSLVAMHPS